MLFQSYLKTEAIIVQYIKYGLTSGCSIPSWRIGKVIKDQEYMIFLIELFL